MKELIAKVLKETKVTCRKYNDEVVTIPFEWPIDVDVNEIALAIADRITEISTLESDDEKYTEHFLQWREKYFTEKVETTRFVSKSTKARISDKELELNYRRAMCKSWLK